ncbi:hypothetical protein OSB04_008349 [Centaurea solstitialis]|uniref:Integrase catalytic domain-containing protein n=1 Tax=Centaurea solstitialis TaxID=347529 RepID=A0AA38TLN3_9ASTR|nr:hypothetical protein OSB04_008349 [Centaurea solstitialis]
MRQWGEYNNKQFHDFFASNGIQFRFSCPHTSQQNGKSERMLRTINNVVRTLLFHSHLPPTFWVEALHMATHLLNLLPSTSINLDTPHYRLFQKHPSYSHLRVFGCLCYPHLTTPHKLAPRSTPCVFLGYPSQHRGFRCLDLSSRCVIISRHVIFDESIFPFGSVTPTDPPSYSFLDDPSDTSPIMCDILQSNTPTTSPSHTETPTSPNNPVEPSDPSTSLPTPPTPQPTHHMTTRAKSGIVKPIQRLNLHTTSISPLPRSHLQALQDPHWQKAMNEEYHALITNRTWELVPRPPGARLVANGRSQQHGVDCDETFSPVVKPATIRTVLSIAVSRNWPIHQLEVKNAFLHGHLQETVYMHQPPGFRDPRFPDHVCHLQRSLYGLKQAPRTWYHRFAEYAVRLGFHRSRTDSSLFIHHSPEATAYLLLYVDDIILTASSTTFLGQIITQLSHEFAMTDLGALNYFLGISACRSPTGLFLSQQKYATEILERANMLNCKPARTPTDSAQKLTADVPTVADSTLYRRLAGALQYLTFTRPDIAFSVQQICLYMHDPREPHFQALKRILRSTSGYCVFLGDNLVSWSSKRQGVISRSSAEAEYRGVANAVAETSWIRNLLRELHTPPTKATIVYCDNVSAVYMSSNPVQHQRTKHIEIDIHFVRDKVAIGQVRVLHVPSRFQYADIFTKGLPSSLFHDFKSSLNWNDLILREVWVLVMLVGSKSRSSVVVGAPQKRHVVGHRIRVLSVAEAEVEEEERSEEESEESSEEDSDVSIQLFGHYGYNRKKGTQGVIEIDNPNMARPKTLKARDVDLDKTTELSRREREEIEKQRAHERYMKLQEQGKTEQARKDLERLALIRQQRAEAAKKREEEKAELEVYTSLSLGKRIEKRSVRGRDGL